jgi:hypothetical protein
VSFAVHVEHAGHQGGDAHLAALLREIARCAEHALDGGVAPAALTHDVDWARIDTLDLQA